MPAFSVWEPATLLIVPFQLKVFSTPFSGKREVQLTLLLLVLAMPPKLAAGTTLLGLMDGWNCGISTPVAVRLLASNSAGLSGEPASSKRWNPMVAWKTVVGLMIWLIDTTPDGGMAV